jgi:O-antigen/teichoic acid export membrane protein
VNPFRNILRLSVGDLLARILSFLAFIYLARVLGVNSYGVVEFALSVAIYLQAFTEGGLDLWATREVAQGKSLKRVAAQVVPLRFLLGLVGFGGLVLLLPLFPDYPQMGLLLVLFGLRAFSQALDLRWVFMGQEKMRVVATGLIIAQVVFAGAVFGLVRGPADVVWVPIVQLVGNLVMAGYFYYWFVASERTLLIRPTFRGIKQALGPSLTLGASRGLALLSFNFDTLLLGFLLSSTAVGLYNAAYRPLAAILTVSATYALALFPALSRTYSGDGQQFSELVLRSLRLTAICAIPIGVSGSFLAAPLVELLFGADYAGAAPVLQVLSWSATLVVLRVTFRQALAASGRQRLDLICATVATAINIGLNLVFIPVFGIVGAAVATLVSEVVWVGAVIFSSARLVPAPAVLVQLARPVIAGGAMVGCFLLTASLPWLLQPLIAGTAYLGVLLLLGDKEVRSWVPRLST